MTKEERLKRLEQMIAGHDADGIVTVFTGDVWDLKADRDVFRELVERALKDGLDESWYVKAKKWLNRP